jgi:Fe-S-cluster-containing dehydrogenase component
MNVSRRTFIKAGIATACALGAETVRSGSADAATGGKPAPGEPLATLIDISRCIGCEECVRACREANQDRYPEPKAPFPRMYPGRVPVEDWSGKRDVTDRLTPYNWLYIQSATVLVDGRETTLTLPRRCMHCVNPPCVKLCPWGSARQEDNGTAVIDPDLCLGGAKCKVVCPWGIPQRQTGVGLYLDLLPAFAGNGVMYKCDRCHARVSRGGLPACIEACPESVQTIGPRSRILQQAHDLAAETGGYLYGETENGGTGTLYLSPVPFGELARAVETGSGRPHLGPARDRMKEAEVLTRAMLLAPVAGVAAAVGRVYRRSRSEKP